MLDALLIFAQEKGQEGPGLTGFLVPIIIMAALFYFLLILPAQRRDRKHRETVLNALKKGDKVVTSAGILGVVHFVKDEEVTLKVEEGKVRVLKSTIARILGAEESAASDAAKQATSEAIKKA
jgi:preprotein translocase subunit YajC